MVLLALLGATINLHPLKCYGSTQVTQVLTYTHTSVMVALSLFKKLTIIAINN